MLKAGVPLIDALDSHQKDPETTMVLIHFYSRYDRDAASQLKAQYGLIDKMKPEAEEEI